MGMHEHSTPLPGELPATWRKRADLFRRHGAEGQAATCEELARELETALEAHMDEELPLEVAEQESGYTTGHLRRLIQEGTIPATERGTIRRRHLPRKPGYLPGQGETQGKPTAPTRPRSPTSKTQLARSVLGKKR